MGLKGDTMKYKFMLILAVFILTCSLLIAQQEVSIYDIQYTTDAGSGTYPSPYEGQTVTLTGIVTASNYYSSGSSLRFFMSEPEGGAWNGIYIFQNTYEVEVGDEVTLTGEVDEYYGVTEITNLSSFSINSSGNPVPDALPASTGDLMAPDTAEQYEGCLVKVQNVETVDTPNNYGEWYVDDGSGACQIDDGIFTYDDPSTGEEFASITGALDYSYDEYAINPREQSDFVAAGNDTIPPTLSSASAPTPQEVELVYSESVSDTTAEDIDNYSITNLTINSIELQGNGKTVIINTSLQTEGETYTITVNNVKDLSGNIIEPNSQIEFTGYEPGAGTQIADIQENFDDYDGEEVTVEGVVTIGDGLLNPDRTKFYIQDESGKGIQIFKYSPLQTSYKRGDKLEVTGSVTKYNSDVEIEDPEITLLGEDYPLPAPKDVMGDEAQIWNGTWAKVVGEISDIWDASQYGFYQITVNVHGTDVPLQFWNSTGADVSEYVVGDNVVAKGIIAFYEGDLQLTCGYEADIYKSGEFEYFKIEPMEPTPEDSVEITFTYPETYTGGADSVYLKWHTMQQEPFNNITMTQGAAYNKFVGTLPAQPAGTMISFYTAILDTSTDELTNFPSSAPNNLESIGYSISQSKAILKVPPRTFCPAMGERMEIQVISQKDDRVVLRLYNSEGKLVKTFFNKNSSGSEIIRWDGKDENFNVLDPGLYICHLSVIKRSTGEKKVDTAPIVIAVPLKN